MLKGKAILITGGTGSLGQALTKEILTYDLKRLAIFSRDEMKQHEMQQRFPTDKYPCLRYFIGDVRNYQRLVEAMSGIDYVIHTAALKIVPTAEYNPFETIETNIGGSQNVIRAALACGVESVLGVSTDKAVCPVNLYGATKLAMERLFVAANHMGRTRFSLVRYGNVLGSRGSIVPFFKSLAKDGGKAIPITDAAMTRFAITLPQAVHFVLRGLADMAGGEIYVPQLPSVLVTDIARTLAPRIPISIIGVRPGEKLHECLISEQEAPHTRYESIAKRYIIYPQIKLWNDQEPYYNPKQESYESNTNTQWIHAGDDLTNLLKTV